MLRGISLSENLEAQEKDLKKTFLIFCLKDFSALDDDDEEAPPGRGRRRRKREEGRKKEEASGGRPFDPHDA